MLGIDLVYIPEFKRQLEQGGATFLEKAFRASELGNRSHEHLAGLWAAKEAVIKASGINTDHWTDVEIDYNDRGAPSGRLKNMNFNISISHQGEYAVAVAQRL